jgi:hypothetical protein
MRRFAIQNVFIKTVVWERNLSMNRNSECEGWIFLTFQVAADRYLCRFYQKKKKIAKHCNRATIKLDNSLL